MPSSSGVRSGACCERCRAVKLTLVTLSLVWAATPACAAPAATLDVVARDGSGDMANAGPGAVAVWIPIVGVALFVFATAVAYYMRKRSTATSTRTATRTATTTSQTSSNQSLLGRMRAWSSRPVTVPGVQPRELTAEQLAGTTRRNNRRRRPNSTASARSTRSLPLYMKEPGEQEVVVFRGGDDYNSESANALLSPVQEGATPDTRASRRDSVSSLAEPETPLLENAMPLTRARTADPSFPPAVPMRTISVRPSMDTIGGTSTDSPALSEDQHDFERERGPAPPYRESISVDQDSGVAFDDLTDAGHGDSARVSTVTTAATAITDSAPEPDRPSAQRGSIGTLRRPHIFGRGESSSGSGSALSVPRLLSLFNPNRPNPNEVEGLPRLSDGEPLPATPPSPVIPRHRARGATVATPPGSPRPGSSGSPYRTHRPSHSGSTSALSAMFRTRSNTSGTGLGAALTSPSTLSVHSISAPLTHTVVRTELMYPRAGPTPEQMKLLASVESFQRFGVPYGPDAIAFASSSRVDLLTPPPVFEEVVGQGSAGEGEADASALRTSTEEAAHFAQDHSPASSPASSPEPSPLPPAAEPVIAAPTSTSQEASPLGAPSPETAAADTPLEEAPSEALAPEEPQPKGPPTLSPYLPTQVSPAQPAEPLTADVVKKILRPLAPPPSSFKVAPAEATPGSARPGSRASSYMTFATAQEGESVPPTPAADAEDHEVQSENTPHASSPSTPKNVLQSLPDTDATTLRDDDGSNTEDAETKMEEAPVASTSSKVAYRKSLDTTSIALPPAQTEAPPVVAAQSETVVV